jgi:tetratricopeptide (TPR) repeat protein
VIVDRPVIDYSQPIVTSDAADLSEEGMQRFNTARAAFLAGNYSAARAAVDEALALTPSDTVLHEFRALVLFAEQRYQDAAATLYAVLSSGPGWDWETMRRLYPSVDVYTAHLRALEKYQRENPDSPEGHFVLAYHYLTTGYTAEAAKQLERVIALKPDDRVSAQLLQLARTDRAPDEIRGEQSPEPNPPAVSAGQEGADFNAADLPGLWNATPAPGAGVALTLNQDKTFRWRRTREGESKELSGTWELASNLLVLKFTEGGTMVGNLTSTGKNKFHFKLVGTPESDPGLDFQKEEESKATE